MELKIAHEIEYANLDKKEVFENVFFMTKKRKLYIHNSESEICSLVDYLKNDPEFLELLK